MSNNMKTSNEFQLYEAQGRGAKGKDDQKWNKRGNALKGKEMGGYMQRDDKSTEYLEHQKHPNKKNYSSYSNKNQSDDYDKSNQSLKGNNQSPTYKKTAKGKKENYGEYPGNNTIDDGTNEKEEYSSYKKSNTQTYGNKDNGGYNQKQKGKHSQNGQTMMNQNVNWDKNQNPLGSYQQLGQNVQGQTQMGGYYDKGNFGGNACQNNYQIQQFNQQGQGQYGYRNHYQGGDHKPNLNMNMPMNNMQQGKGLNAFNINNHQFNQTNIQYGNTEGSYYNNISSSINQDKEPESDGEDNYIPSQSQQYSIKSPSLYMQDHLEGNAYLQHINDQMLPNTMNQPNFQMMNPNVPIQPFQPMNRIQDLYFQQQMPGQGNSFLVDPQMLKGVGRVPNMRMMNIPQVDQNNQMYQMSQVPYGMNNNNSGGQGMAKTKNKSSKKIVSQHQDGSNGNNSNNNNSMKMHYNNNNGKYYKGSHSMQGVKNTIPNFNGGNLSFMNMSNSNSNSRNINNDIGTNSSNPINMSLNPQMNISNPLSNQQMQMQNPSFSSNQGNVKGYFKQKRTSNPYRAVISDKTVGTSVSGGSTTVPLTKPKQNDYYNSNKTQQPQHKYHKYNTQATQNYQHKSESKFTHNLLPLLALSNLETDYDASVMGNHQEPSHLDVSLFIKVKLEDHREVVVELKNNKDPLNVAEELKSYNIKDDQLNYIFNKIVEALSISDKILHVPLEAYDRKQLVTFNKVTSQLNNQSHKKLGHSLFHFPIIQLDSVDNSFSFQTSPYESIVNAIKPEYTDTLQSDLLNMTQ